MNRYEVVFKIRLSKKLRDSIIEDAQKREKKTSVYVREQLDRTFRFSQTDIKKIEKKINVISDAGKKINMIARKHNTDGITEVDDETFIHLDEIRKSLEDILVIMSQEKNLDYHTQGRGRGKRFNFCGANVIGKIQGNKKTFKGAGNKHDFNN